MGFRMRKSFKIAPGVRMTVTPKSLGLSAGVRGARISANSSGRVTRTVGIPGSGLSHVSSSSTAAGRKRAAPGSTSGRSNISPEPARPPAPGLFAPKWEKLLFRAVASRPDPGRLPDIGTEFERARHTAAFFEVLDLAWPAGDIERASELLGLLLAGNYDATSDPFITKYLPGRTHSEIAIAEGITVELPTNSEFIGLLLAETLQLQGMLQRAVNVVEGLVPSTIAAVSLAELYIELGSWDQVVELTDGVTNLDEASTYLLIQRGIALRHLGYVDASREALREALRMRSRPAGLRHRALVERAQLQLTAGKRAMARKDLERVLAEDSRYPGLVERLAELDS